MDLFDREKDTICAPITAPASAGVGVIRISGDKALSLTRQLCDFLPASPESHRVYYGFLKDKLSQEDIDEVLVTYFAQGRSFTGDETIEISCHGSPAILNKVLKLLVAEGCRPAERGEFTFRAFSNGRIDLMQAESVLSLVQSHSEQASRLALRQLQGSLSKEIRNIEDDITWTLANIEAGIDFTHEDIDVLSYVELDTRVDKVVNSVNKLISTYDNSRLITEGLRVVFTGRPNAGKSSLLNAILDQNRAIVSSVAGTTRDLIEAQFKVEGGTITLVDSAGLRETNDEVEKLGIQATRESFINADIVGYLFDINQGLTAEDKSYIESLPAGKILLIGTKADEASDLEYQETMKVAVQQLSSPPATFLLTSAKAKTGIEELKLFLKDFVRSSFVDDSAVLIHKRHFELLKTTAEKSLAAKELLKEKASLEFVALELREALEPVYEMQGKRIDDQIMDKVFKEFCIGK